MTVRILGVPYDVTFVERIHDVAHNGDDERLHGQISYERRSIRVCDEGPEQTIRTLLHEILHGVIEAQHVRELIGDDGEHSEAAIHQLALGLAEALESLGVRSLGHKTPEA